MLLFFSTFIATRTSKGLAIALALAAALVGGAAVGSAAPADQAATPTRAAAPGCTPTPQIVVLVENPSPGDVLTAGNNVVINGVAYDSASTSGAGIDKVTAYLGDRDAGGIFLGNAILGQPSPIAAAGSQFATAGFTLRSLTLPTGTGARDLFVYAHSSVSDREGIADVPLFLGAVPTPVKGTVPTAVLPTPVPCTPTPVPTTTATPLPPTSIPLPAFPTPIIPATLAPLPTAALPPPSAPAVAAVLPSTPTPRAVVASTAPATAAATTAPRGGGIPSELGLLILAAGAVVFGGGLAWRRRERGAASVESDPPATT